MQSQIKTSSVDEKRRLTRDTTVHLSVTDPLLTAKEAAAYRRQGVSTLWRHVKMGLVSKPIYITPRSPRWRLSDLCPKCPAVIPNN